MNNEIDYSIMDETVDKICESLLLEPEGWSFDVYYIVAPKKFNSISIYKGLSDEFISVKNSSYGTANSEVFSLEQGKKIKNAYYKALSNIGSNKQKEIMNSMMNAASREESNKLDTKNTLNSIEEKRCTISGILFLIAIFILIIR